MSQRRRSRNTRGHTEGWEGWDDYARFYDWENARTLCRRDVAFWRAQALHASGRVLELGCGTGRISVPLGKAGVQVVGLDRSESMLTRARARVRRARLERHVHLVRGDIRQLPFSDPTPRRSQPAAHTFPLVIAPYGVLQSLLRERDLSDALGAVRRVLAPGGTFGLELVADLPSWEEYTDRVSLEGWRGRKGGTRVTLVESVIQDRRRHRTVFDQEFTEREGRTRRVHRFSLTFRTLTVRQMSTRLERAGFEISALLGDYRGGPWDPRAEVWIVMAKAV